MQFSALLANPAFTDKLVILAVLIAAIVKLGVERQAREDAREATRSRRPTSRRRR